jgi:hypothetical protein
MYGFSSFAEFTFVPHNSQITLVYRVHGKIIQLLPHVDKWLVLTGLPITFPPAIVIALVFSAFIFRPTQANSKSISIRIQLLLRPSTVFCPVPSTIEQLQHHI